MNDRQKNTKAVRELLVDIHYGYTSLDDTGKPAVEALVKMGPAAVPALIKALKSKHFQFSRGKAWVAKALGELGDPRAVPSLIKALKNVYEEECVEAVWALGNFDDPRIVPALIKALTRVSELRWLFGRGAFTYFELNAAAAVMLGRLGDPQAVPALIQALQNEKGDWRVRQNAVAALRAIGDRRAVPALTEVLEDKGLYFLLRHDAAKALEVLGGQQAVSALIQALRNEGVVHEGIVPESAAPDAAETQVRDPQAVLALIQVLQDETQCDWEHTEAIEALGATKDAQAVAALAEFLNDSDADRGVREDAVDALQAVGTPQAILALVEALADEDVHWEATWALEKIGTPAVPALVEALNHPSRETRLRVVEVLGSIEDPQAVPALIKTLTGAERDGALRHYALEALGLIGSPEAVPALIEALSDKDSFINEAAAKGLKEIMQHYSDLDLRAALPALRRLQKGDPVFREVLEQIEAATGAFQDLPVPAAAPPLDIQSLPRPAADADTSPDASLPAPPGRWMRLYRMLRGPLAGKATKIRE